MSHIPQAQKIKKIDELAGIVRELKKSGKKIVQAHGVFDLVHPGHIHHFKQAKELGDILVVSLVEDRFVRKGLGRPVFNEAIRSEWLAALEAVDYLVFCGDIGPYDVLRAIQPHFYVKGESCKPLLDDPKSGLSEDKRVCDSIGTVIRFLKDFKTKSSGVKISSTALFEEIQKFFD